MYILFLLFRISKHIVINNKNALNILYIQFFYPFLCTEILYCNVLAKNDQLILPH